MTESNVPAVGQAPPAAPPADAKQSRSPNEEDLKALLASRDKKIAEMDQREKAREARMQELERRIMPQQAADPLNEGLNSLRLREVAGDAEAHAQLEIGRQAANTQADLNRTNAMIEAKVPAEHWGAVRRVLSNDIAPTPERVQEALKYVRGQKIDDVEGEVAKLRDEKAKLEKALEQARTAPRVPNMALRPAAIPNDAGTITAAEAREIFRRGGEEARKLKARIESPRGSDGHLDVDYTKK